MRRSDPDVLARLAQIAAGWTPPVLRAEVHADQANPPQDAHGRARVGERRGILAIVLVVLAAALVTIAWVMVGRARPVVAVPELSAWPTTATAVAIPVSPQTDASPDPRSRQAPAPAAEPGAAGPASGQVERAPGSGGPSAGTAPAADPQPPSSGTGMIVVHVAGPVRRPGVVVLPVGSRVIDALDAAGGIRKGGDVGATNLAALVSDGQRVEIGAATPAPAGAQTSAGQVGSSSGPESSGPVNLNTATAEQLDALPGVGPVTATKIIDWRAANGRFNSVDELGEVSGIGPVKLAELRPHVCV